MAHEGDIRRFFGANAGSRRTADANPPRPQDPSRPAKKEFKQAAGSQPGPSTAASASLLDGAADRSGSWGGAAAAGASFSSAATSSSQRRVMNGVELVLDSSDSGSDLELADELLRKFQQPAKPKDAPMRDDDGAEDSITVVSSRPKRKASPAPKPAAQARREHAKSKYSLDRLAASVARDRESESSIAALLSSIGDSGTRSTALESPERKRAIAGRLDPAMLATMMGDGQGEDGVERLLHAVERTEAARSAKAWYFFETQPRPPSVPAPPHVLLARWKTAARAELAFAEGMVTEAAACGQLPKFGEDVLNWGFRSTVNDPDDIQHHYCAMLQMAETQGTWRFSAEWVRSMFAILGATDEALDATREAKPTGGASDEQANEAGWDSVRRVLELVPRMAQVSRTPISTADRLAVIGMLCKLAIDPNVGVRRKLSFALQDALDALLESLPKDESVTSRLVDELGARIRDPQLRLQLLHGLADAVPRMASVRHRLALSFLLGADAGSKPLDLLARLSDCLTRGADFRIRPDMDFAWLASMIGVLDVAVGDGSPERQPERMAPDRRRQLDRAVDALAGRVKFMSSQIRDTGANHFSKTEAKEALDALHMRLLYAVRTEPRPKRNVFGASVGLPDMESSGLDSFLVRSAGGGSGATPAAELAVKQGASSPATSSD